jgi:Flp pilus assembly protein TadG
MAAAAADRRRAGIGPWRRGRHWLTRRVGRSDRGASAVELAVLAPGLMMLCMLILQFGLWFNARQVALAAAQAGATVARQEAASDPAGWQADAQSAATTYYTRLHSNLLTKIAPSAYGSPGSNVYVTVKGQLGYSVFPFFALNLNISATAGGPIECFRPAGQNGC